MKMVELNEELFIKLTDEVNWYRTYGEFINTNYPHVDGEACAYADEIEMKQE